MEELPIRYLRVDSIDPITAHLVRIKFSAERLGDLLDGSPDQQVKLYFPKPGQEQPRLPQPENDYMSWYQAYSAMPDDERPWMRSFTIRGHDLDAGTLDIDFVLHAGSAPAVSWARRAEPGDVVGMFGPSQNFARKVPLVDSIGAADWLLLVGDETALPAIGTILESLPKGHPTVAFLEVDNRAEELKFDTLGEVQIRWFHRDGAAPGTISLLPDAVRSADFPDGRVFAWLAGEAKTVRALRRHLVNDRDVDKKSIDFAGYWRYSLTQDDDPTAEDMAEAQERLAEAGLDGQQGKWG